MESFEDPSLINWYITGRKTRTVRRMVHDLLVLAVYTVAGPTGSIEPSNFHLFEIIKKHQAGKRFVTDVFVKQFLSSWLQTLDTDFF
jgi:hypothetical protein